MQRAGTATAAEVEEALRGVLARPEYAAADPPLLYRWLGTVAEWWRGTARPFLSRIFPEPDWSSPAWEVLGMVLLALGALAGALILGYLVVLAGRAWRARKRRGRPTAGTGAIAPGAAEWEARAAAAAERGEWRRAAQDLYQAVVLRLAEREVLRVDPSKTPGDYRREARRHGGPLQPAVEAFLAWFERVAYGRGEPGPDEYARLHSAAAALGSRG